MKKFLCLFSALTLVLASCSSDDSSSDEIASDIKPTKITYLYPDASENFFTDIKYDGNKILSASDSDGYTIKYTYTGNLITKTEEFGSGNVLESTIEYVYLNGKLDFEVEKRTSSTKYYKTKYTHKADGTIDFEEFFVDPATGIEQEGGKVGKYTYKDGNLIKNESSYYGNANTTYTYEYDTKNNPRKNFLGLNLLVDYEETISVNNVVKKIGTSSSSTFLNTYSYLYNSDNFPTEQKASDNNGVLYETTQYTY